MRLTRTQKRARVGLMKKRLLRAYARRGTLPWCRQTLVQFDAALVRAAERHFASHSVFDLIRLAGGELKAEWISSRPRNFRGEQTNRSAPDAFERAVGMLSRAFAKGVKDRTRSKLPHNRKRWLGYAFLKRFEPGANATAHWLHRIWRLQEALEVAGPEVAAAWFHKPRKYPIIRRRQPWLAQDHPRVVAAERELQRLGIPLVYLGSRPATPAPIAKARLPMAPQPRFGSMGGKKRRPAAQSPTPSDWEYDEDPLRRGPIEAIDEALEELSASPDRDSLTRLVR